MKDACFPVSDHFAHRHVGSGPEDVQAMLTTIGEPSLEGLMGKIVPEGIRLNRPLNLPAGLSEHVALAKLRQIALQNEVYTSYIGQGYYDTITPAVIQRNILENPGWYTAYTPYQPEISQGRLEALLNFQTMIGDLTGLPLANASLLDEATAAAEAMNMSRNLWEGPSATYFVSEGCHPQTLVVLRTRAEAVGVELIVGDHRTFAFDRPIFGALLQYPAGDGAIYDYRGFIQKCHAAKALVTLAADLLALTLLTPPGELGADIAVGSTQRFGVPMGFGGPHAAYFATREEYKRSIPGRIVGVSHDVHGRRALRLALQTREQHIRRDRATSNICTAQVLPAVLAVFYAIHHGPEGLKRIAERIHGLTVTLAENLRKLGFSLPDTPFFDTLRVGLGHRSLAELLPRCAERRINVRVFDEHTVGVSLDETTTAEDVETLLTAFSAGPWPVRSQNQSTGQALSLTKHPGQTPAFTEELVRKSPFLTHPVFQKYQCEHELLRYIKRLEAKDLSLTTSMIPLGSCTMKLNAAVEMLPITWPEFARLHPFAPAEQTQGYQTLIRQLESDLAEITGFAAVSLQPNAGSQGEFAGLLVIRKHHQSRGEGRRNVCLIPTSAHGTNPASAVMAGFKVVPVACDAGGNVDLADLENKAQAHAADLAALMVTYPSTHGVFEEKIKDICALVHRYGGQVYMDGANMNALVGLCRPGDIGADVCHLNLHKTFSIPHGGGGPGVGPIAVAKHLAAFLPTCRTGILPVSQNIDRQDKDRQDACPTPWAVSAAPYGSASILPISWMYLRLLGAEGLKYASELAILNANYVAKRLSSCFPVLYTGKNGYVAHECILDMRTIKPSAGVDVSDVAKRLMDYGFHAPTMSWPVGETLMVEPTESESKAELDRFCEALIRIHAEIEAVRTGSADKKDNVLKNAPHTAAEVTATEWKHPYPREQAAYPAEWLRDHKYWPGVGRVDNAYGDRHLICTCEPMVAEQKA